MVIVVGDEAGEAGDQFARIFRECGYQVAAMAVLVSVANQGARGNSVRSCAGQLKVPFSEVAVESFDDRRTTVTADRSLMEAHMRAADRGRVGDQVGAAVMLQAWLDRRAAR